jgi:hypothetical protein
MHDLSDRLEDVYASGFGENNGFGTPSAVDSLGSPKVRSLCSLLCLLDSQASSLFIRVIGWCSIQRMDVLEVLQGLDVTPRATAAISARLIKVGETYIYIDVHR